MAFELLRDADPRSEVGLALGAAGVTALRIDAVARIVSHAVDLIDKHAKVGGRPLGPRPGGFACVGTLR